MPVVGRFTSRDGIGSEAFHADASCHHGIDIARWAQWFGPPSRERRWSAAGNKAMA
jgi:hypothetical protein